MESENANNGNELNFEIHNKFPGIEEVIKS